MGGQGDVLQVSEWGAGLLEASQWKSGTPSLDWWSTQENHTCRVPTQASGFGWPYLMRTGCFWVKVSVCLHLPLPQVFEHWLITGLQTYTGACLERGNKPDFGPGWFCWRKITFRHHISKWEWDFSLFSLYLSLWLPSNGTNVYHTGHRIRWSYLIWTEALIHFNILIVLLPNTWHDAFCLSWPTHCWTLPWLWHTPSVNKHKWVKHKNPTFPRCKQC